MNHIWLAKNVMKGSKNFQTKDREYQYDMLDLSDKERDQIAVFKQKRLERKAKSKQTN
jgi:hypothetical protein